MNKKRALCVGNNYPGTNAELAGCVNDARDWTALLANEGYEVTTLEEATLETVVSELTKLVSITGWADRIVFTYSGHGTWVPDRDGDEADGRDEAMVMADYLDGGLLLDDTLQRIFSGLRFGAAALVLSDSCHSGTMNRFLGVRRADAQARFLSPATFFEGLTEERALDLEEKPASTPRSTSSLISGCADLEYSYDASFNGRPNGAFSRAAIDAFQSGISQSRWFHAIREALPTDWYPQSPQLTAASLYRKYTRAI